MYGLTIKYKGPEYYIFIYNIQNTIYIGAAKNINTRLSQYFLIKNLM